jgi:hypothetical protein
MKKKALRIVGLLCLLSIITGLLIGYRMYNKPHKSVATENAVTLSAARLAGEYEKDETASNKKYLGNAVQVSGTVSEVTMNQQNKPVVLLTGSEMSGVQCTLQDSVAGIKKGDSICIKGFCTGYLTDVIVDRCIVAHNP